MLSNGTFTGAGRYKAFTVVGNRKYVSLDQAPPQLIIGNTFRVPTPTGFVYLEAVESAHAYCFESAFYTHCILC